MKLVSASKLESTDHDLQARNSDGVPSTLDVHSIHSELREPPAFRESVLPAVRIVDAATKAAGLYWCDQWVADRARTVALSSWSTFTRLSAELYGRHYGGGVLKLEIGPARRLPVILPSEPTVLDGRLSRLSGEQARRW